MVVDNLSYTEIRDFDSIIMYQNVLGLYISMDDVSIFEKLQSNDDLSDKPANDLIGQAFLVILNEVLQSSFVAIFDEKEERVGTLLCIDILQNIWMRNLSQKVYLLE